MTKHRTRAAALLAAGALAGGVTAATLTATADDTGSGSGDGSSAASADRGGRPGPGGPGGHRGPGGPGVDATALAEALGVSEDELTEALEKAREETRPESAGKPADGERPTPPTEAERAEREAAFATALADALGVGEAKVTEALEDVRAARTAERRTDLVERLDQAVTDGELTEADKASVLKAYDAGVLGGRR